MTRAQPEHRLQAAIVQYLALRGFWAVAVPNGAQVAGNARQRAMRVGFMKREGLCPGFPDLIVLAGDGRTGFIETKVEGSYQSAAQKDCQARLEALGHHYAVCRSLEDVEETLARWNWITPLRAPDGAKMRPAVVSA